MNPNLVKYMVITAILVFCLLLFSSSGTTTEFHHAESSPLLPMFVEWNDCLLKYISPYRNDKQGIWKNLAKGVKQCETLDAITKLRFQSFHNSDETKWHITPKNGESSTIITLGIGHDTRAEESLKPKLSKDSKFFGADPMVEINEALYNKVGNFFPFAVGADAGLSVASVLNKTYIDKIVVHVDLIYFLKKILKVDFVDDIWMDAENAEYGMMPFFYRGGELDRNGITVCQMNIEIHLPDDAKKQALHDFIFSILADQRYGVLRPIQGNHMRLYLLNFEDSVCVNRYIN